LNTGLALAAAALFGTPAFSSVEANTIRVPGDVPTIQAAIDTAVSGDVVIVAPGIYTERLTIADKAITLASQFYESGDPAVIGQTVLDGGGGGSVISVEATATGSKIIGFTVQNGEDGIAVRTQAEVLNNVFRGNNDGISFTNGSGVVRDNLLEGNEDDGIDFDQASSGLVENNVVRSNGNDGLEIRLHNYNGPTLNITIRGNTITGSQGDGIQLIDYSRLSDRVLRIEKNLIQGNVDAGLGLMDNGRTSEDFRGASIPERIYVLNNTFSDNAYALTGGDNLIALNNLFINTPVLGIKNVDGSSIAAYNLFWNNTAHYEASNVDTNTTKIVDPLLDASWQLTASSPAVDAGTAYFVHNGEVVLDYPPGTFAGGAPDLGWRESSSSRYSIPSVSPETRTASKERSIPSCER